MHDLENNAAPDPDFPSGEWVGFYQEHGNNVRQELRMEFSEGNIRGDGIDLVGDFEIRGRYDSKSYEAWWTKTYPGRHRVFYRGFREVKGIWGTWEIPPHQRNGFHIWPRAMGLGNTHHVEEAAPEPLVSAAPAFVPAEAHSS